jgi:hypothetical protein
MTRLIFRGAIVSLRIVPQHLIQLMRDAIARCALDLSDTTILTEAASDAYAVTPVLAALANARRVFAFTRSSRFGSASQIERETEALAKAAGVADRIEILTEKPAVIVAAADIITNSGHLRPLDREMVSQMKPAAVVPLMYEAWEAREADIDVAECARRYIAVAGTNERHPAVAVLPFLSAVAARLLLDAGLTLRGSRILICCDNPFRPFLAQDLLGAGALVEIVDGIEAIGDAPPSDAILLAMMPKPHQVVGVREAATIARRHPGTTVVQFWGDMDREALTRGGVRFWPQAAPPLGHQGIMLSSIGAEPIVRLQAGGLKVGELMARVRMSQGGGASSCANAIAAAVTSGFGQPLTP